MNQLEQALTTKFAATSALTTPLTGNGTRLFWDLAKPGTNPPYLVASVVTSVGTTAFAGSFNGDVRVQFKVIAGGRTAAHDLMDTVIGVFDAFVPTVTGHTCTNVQRAGWPFGMELPRDKSSVENYQVMADYVYTIAT